jgi:hypothetical protein
MARKNQAVNRYGNQSAKPKNADYQLYDGDGLTLLIKSSGSKLRQFRYYRPLTRHRTNKASVPILPSHFLMRVNSELNLEFYWRKTLILRNIRKNR